jgi:hypothetical protein
VGRRVRKSRQKEAAGAADAGPMQIEWSEGGGIEILKWFQGDAEAWSSDKKTLERFIAKRRAGAGRLWSRIRPLKRSEPRLAFNRIVVVRYRMYLESQSGRGHRQPPFLTSTKSAMVQRPAAEAYAPQGLKP